jgi:hypothetical protein
MTENLALYVFEQDRLPDCCSAFATVPQTFVFEEASYSKPWLSGTCILDQILHLYTIRIEISHAVFQIFLEYMVSKLV